MLLYYNKHACFWLMGIFCLVVSLSLSLVCQVAMSWCSQLTSQSVRSPHTKQNMTVVISYLHIYPCITDKG